MTSAGVDLLSIAGHKLYAPKGGGALYVKRGVHLEKLMEVAGQECGRRPGTENVLEIAGLGTACEVDVSVTSAGQITNQFGPPPYFVLIEQA